MAKRDDAIAHKTNKNKIRMLEELKRSMGIVSLACDKANLSRTQFYKWLKDDDDFRQKYEEIEERQIDFVESRLFQNIKNGDATSIIFYLKTKGKKRGYQEKTEIDIRQVDLPIIEIDAEEVE
jgi:hypothetical protein